MAMLSDLYRQIKVQKSKCTPLPSRLIRTQCQLYIKNAWLVLILAYGRGATELDCVSLNYICNLHISFTSSDNTLTRKHITYPLSGV